MASIVRFLPKRLQEPDLLLIYINVALYALCFQMQQPAQLGLVKSLVEGDDAKQQFAWVKSVNGVAQLGGSLLSGILIDRMGCNGVMLLSLFASVLSYGLVATATDVSHLYLAQLPTVFQHAVLAARAYVSITLDDSERAEYLGYIGFAYGIGVVIGPALGGYLSFSSLRSTAWIAVAGSVLSIALVLVFWPGNTKKKSRGEAPADAKPSASSLWQGYKRIWQSPPLWHALMLKTLFSFAFSIFHSTFQLVADDRFHMDTASSGTLLSVVGVVGMISQAGLIKVVNARFSERTITMSSTLLLSICFGVYALISDSASLFALCVPMVALSTLFQLVNSAQIVRASPPELKGTLVAVDMALFSGMRIWTPAFGAYLFAHYGYASLGAVSGAAILLVTLLIFTNTANAVKSSPKDD